MQDMTTTSQPTFLKKNIKTPQCSKTAHDELFMTLGAWKLPLVRQK